jgi:mono/diheme cytochrome c family protein
MSRTTLVSIVGLALVAVVAAVFLLTPRGNREAASEPQFAAPSRLAAEARTGEALFAANCAACHGAQGGGTEQGPPLVHRIYEPGHHPDIAFRVAVQNGVRSHHWRFGNMPPQPQVSETDIEAIIAYVRTIQRGSGIN